MKAILTKNDVVAAIKQLADEGKKVTLNSLHAALGGRGSMTTLVNLKAEIDGERLKIIDSPEGLKAFREVWALAVDEGRKQQEGFVLQLRSDCSALAAENSRLEGMATEAVSRASDCLAAKSATESELTTLKTQLEAELSKAKTDLVRAGDQAREALSQLAQAQITHSQEVRTLREQLEAVHKKHHQLELELVHTKALLEVSQNGKRRN